MKVTIVGTGYVGLVTGACFSEVGHHVTCVDIDEHKIEQLRQGEMPIYEPGLEQLVRSNQQADRLAFTTSLRDALREGELVFIAVGTPQRQDGSANLTHVWSVVDQIRELATESKLVVIKSTVPVGTNSKVHLRLNDGGSIQHSVASNPEFLRQGLAVEDALHPDRVVVGLHDLRERERLEELYLPFTNKGVPLLFMRWESSEMTKYVANCVLATKISYINEMANMCEALGADVNDVREGIGHDKRIGSQFLAPGVGFGGSCFPKDVRAMKSMARQQKTPMRILEAVDYVNEEQKRAAFQKLNDAFNGQLARTTVAVWGLAFKPETDDIREAPALVLLQQLRDAGVKVRAYDPKASENARQRFAEDVEFCDDKYTAADGADALVIMTEWDEFKHVDFDQLAERLNGNVIIDGRNIYSPRDVASKGFVYSSVGRSTAYPDMVLENQAIVDDLETSRA